jgi:hypothetical protein
MAITALPPAPARTDAPATFVTKADTFLSALGQFTTDVNTTATQVSTNATNAATSATNSATSATQSASSAADAATSANTAGAMAGAVKWVSGTTYANGAAVWSPANMLVYRRKTASGSGVTDPSTDVANYTLISTPLPDQTGQDGKYLQSVAGTQVWKTVPSAIGNILTLPVANTSPTYTSVTGDVYLKSGTVVTRAAAITAGYDVTGLESIGASGPRPIGPLGLSSVRGAMAYGAGKFVTCGAGGVIKYSVDGITWGTATSGTATDLQEIAFINNQFVIAGLSVILSSPDGVTWTTRTSPNSNAKYRISWIAGVYVLSCATVGVVSSPDLVSWTGASSWQPGTGSGVIVAGTLYCSGGTGGIYTVDSTGVVKQVVTDVTQYTIAYTGTKFIAIASGTTASKWSSDGVTWNSATSSAAGTWSTFTGQPNIASNGTTTAACTSAGIQYTTDGISWTSVTTLSGMYYVAYVGSLFIQYGPNTLGLSTSPNGTTWTNRTLPINSYVLSATYGAGLYVVTSWNGVDTAYTYSSPDGVTWTQRATAPANSANTYVSFLNGMFIQTLDSTMKVSSNGTTWTTPTTVPNTGGSYLGVASYANGYWVVAGSVSASGVGTGFYSTTATGTWTPISVVNPQVTTAALLSYFLYSGGKLFGIGPACFYGANGTPVTMTQGVTGGMSTSNAANASFATDGNVLFAYIAGITSFSAVHATRDGKNWSPVGSYPVGLTNVFNSSYLSDFTYTNGKFIGTFNGSANVMYSSDGGISWTYVAPANGMTSLVSIGWNGSLWFANNAGTIGGVTSPDLVTWTPRYTSGYPMMRMAYGGGSYTGIDTAGNVSITPDGYTGAIGVSVAVVVTGATTFVKVK